MKLLLAMLGLVLLALVAVSAETQSVTKVWNSLEPGDTLRGEFRAQGLSFYNIDFEFINYTNPAKVEAMGRDRKLVTTTEAMFDRVYQYVDITTNIGKRATVPFLEIKVPLAWIQELNFTKDDLGIKWWNGTDWKNMSVTAIVREDSVSMNTSLPYLDDLAVGANRPTEPVPMLISDNETDETNASVPEFNISDNTSIIQPEQNDTEFESITDPSPSKGIPSFVWIILIVLVVLGGIVGLLELMSRRRRKEFN
ncbi:MAG: hypothetical protein ABIA93_01570 [Candidatus Woesearchaeota archaeon]